MTNEEILQQAIEKAVKNGWDKCISVNANSVSTFKYHKMYFDHDFAKAFWKDAKGSKDIMKCPQCEDNTWDIFDENWCPTYCSDCGEKLRKEKEKYGLSWSALLREMVTEEEPLKYLEKFL